MQAIRDSHKTFVPDQRMKGDNLALRLSKFNADIDADGEHEQKDQMLDMLCEYSMNKAQKDSYEYAYNRWQSLIQNHPETLSFTIQSTTKCLLGMGNASVHEFGVSLNYPFGVPYISGTVIKGLLSSYLAKHGGDDWYKSPEDSKKSDLQVELFGGDAEQGNETKSYIGSVIFNDAWLVPSNDKWFVPDIINVHHQKYYSQQRLPDGMENPIPIKLAAMSPGLQFFVSLQGDDAAVQFLLPVLADALKEDGLGSKTATGYGRFELLGSCEMILKEKQALSVVVKKERADRQEQLRKEAERDALTVQGQIIFDLDELLSQSITDNIKMEINKALKEAENSLDSWPMDDRQKLAKVMADFFEKTSWFEAGKTKKQKAKQQAKKEARIAKVRG